MLGYLTQLLMIVIMAIIFKVFERSHLISYLQLLRDKIRRRIGILFFDKKIPEGLQGDINHILIIRWDAKLGDSYLSSFFFREIKKLANKKVTVITTPALKSLYEDDFFVDEVIAIEKRPSYTTLAKTAKRVGNVDLVIHLTENMKMKDLYFLNKLAPKNVASLDDELDFVNVKLAQSTAHLLFQDKYRILLEMLGLATVDMQYIIPLKKPPLATTDKVKIIVNPFGSTRYKSMAEQKSISVLAILAKSYPSLSFELLSSPATLTSAKNIITQCAMTNVELAKNINSIDDAIAHIQAAHVVISVDTAIVHIAAGLKKPLLAIYPCHGDRFNQWLPSQSSLTQVLFSSSPSINADMNHVDNHEIVEAVAKLLTVAGLTVPDVQSPAPL